jgi:FkbM family methyltransferase
MRTAVLPDGTKVYCLLRTEAKVLDSHVNGYLAHGIEIREGDTIFDVGANIGLFGIRAMQRTKSARVFAFEPVPAIYEVLRMNAELFGKVRFLALPFGLASAPGKALFRYYPNSPALSTSHPEIWDENPESLAHAVAGSMKNAPPELWWARLLPRAAIPLIAKRLRKGSQTFECSLKTISGVIEEFRIEEIHLLKIDCEGAEWEVLNGIRADDWPKIAKIVVEVHDTAGRLEDVKRLLSRQGFRNLATEKEASLENTALINLYATR